MYRIFINDNALILSSSSIVLEVDKLAQIRKYSSASSMTNAINKLENGFYKSIVLHGDDLALMWQDFCSRYQIIEAAGGVVVNPMGEVLWIRRNEKWDLPKGKIELGEKIEDTAVREVEEECAVFNISLGELLGITYHTYSCKGENVLKKSYWYAMTCPIEQELSPQLEEGITAVVWANKQNHLTYLKDTYTSIAELLKREKVQHHLGF